MHDEDDNPTNGGSSSESLIPLEIDPLLAPVVVPSGSAEKLVAKGDGKAANKKKKRPNARFLDWYRRYIEEFQSIQAIARKDGYSEARVRYGLKKVEEWVIGGFKEEVFVRKVHQTTRLRRLEREAWEAWNESKKDKRTVRTTHSGDGNREQEGGAIQVQTEVRQQGGDPRYLDLIRGFMKDERDLWGLDEPKRKELTGKKGGPIQLRVGEMSDDELAAILAED
jgi:hypothetical protein